MTVIPSISSTDSGGIPSIDAIHPLMPAKRQRYRIKIEFYQVTKDACPLL